MKWLTSVTMCLSVLQLTRMSVWLNYVKEIAIDNLVKIYSNKTRTRKDATKLIQNK